MGSRLLAVGVLSVPPVVVTSEAEKPVGASLKAKVTVALSLLLSAALSLLMARAGASVSIAWAPLLAKLASATGLPAASARPVARRLKATVPSALAVGLTTTV